MLLNQNIVCAVLNYKKLDDRAISNLKLASLSSDVKKLKKLKDDIDVDVGSIAIIKKCNAIIIVFFYKNNFSYNHVRNNLIFAWDKNAGVNGLSELIGDIKIYEGVDAVKYLAEVAVGIHSVTLGDSQVSFQVNDALVSGIDNDGCLSILAKWILYIVDECKLKTNIFGGNTSLERIACELVERNVPHKKKIVLFGYGRSGKLIAKILNREYGLSLSIVNRTIVNVEQEKLDTKLVKYLSFEDIKEMVDFDSVGCVLIALENNKITKKIINENIKLFLKLKGMYIVDLASPPLLPKSDGKIIDIKYLSKIAEENVRERSNEVGKVRNIIGKELYIFTKSINKNFGKRYITEQRKSVLKINSDAVNLTRIRGGLLKKIRSVLDEMNFIEIITPSIVGVSTDPPKIDNGGTIDVKWKDEVPAFLRQSNQVYKQMLIAYGLEKVYEIGPFWRKETFESYRHLQETVGLDVEFKNPKSLEDVYELACKIISKTNNALIERFELEEHLFIPEYKKIPVITYKESVQMLRKNNVPIQMGDDLGLVNEEKLGHVMKKKHGFDIFIIKNYPNSIKKFYTKDKKGGLTETFDIIADGWELVSGAIRQTDGDKIRRSMSLSGINSKEYEFYISAIDNSVEHGGFCIGLDRLLAKILGKDTIHDSVPFPRTYKKLIP